MQHRISARFTARFYTGLFLLSSEEVVMDVAASSSSAMPIDAAAAAGIEGSATRVQRTTAQRRVDAIREAWITYTAANPPTE
jgi:hypothetical protein